MRSIYKCCNVNSVAENTIYVICFLKEWCVCVRGHIHAHTQTDIFERKEGEEKRGVERREGAGEHSVPTRAHV